MGKKQKLSDKRTRRCCWRSMVEKPTRMPPSFVMLLLWNPRDTSSTTNQVLSKEPQKCHPSQSIQRTFSLIITLLYGAVGGQTFAGVILAVILCSKPAFVLVRRARKL